MKVMKEFGGCLKASPVFCGEIRELEARYSDSKQHFDANIIAGCIRCKFGRVKVLVCSPMTRKGRPFPTTFWLTCPYLSKLAGRIEAEGGVHELEEYLRVRELGREWRRYNFGHQLVRLGLMDGKTRGFLWHYRNRMFRALMRSGIGGMRDGESISVKCLHLQTASLIGMGYHPASEWLKSRGLYGDCGNSLCSKKNYPPEHVKRVLLFMMMLLALSLHQIPNLLQCLLNLCTFTSSALS